MKKTLQKNIHIQKTTLSDDMSNYKRKNRGYGENGFRKKGCGFEEKGCGFEEKGCGFEEKGCGFEEKGCGVGGWDDGYEWGKYGCGEEEKYKSGRNCFIDANNKSACNDADHKQGRRSCSSHEVDSHNVNKDFEDIHERKNQDKRRNQANICSNNRSNKNHKYLVDKLYIYEHHRVIDLDCCENKNDLRKARNDFKDLECAARDFRDQEVRVKDYSDENDKHLEAYQAARKHSRALQNQRHNDNAAYVWGN